MSRTTYECLLDGKVYIGGVDAIERADEQHSIDTFFDLRGTSHPPVHEKSVHTPLQDGKEVESLQLAVQQMKKAIQDGKTIYMHCNTGRGRTGAAATALLLELNEATTVDEAVAYATSKRDVIDIRPNFEAALRELYDV